MPLIEKTIGAWWARFFARAGQILFVDRARQDQRGADASFTYDGSDATDRHADLAGEFRAQSFRGQLFHGKDDNPPADTTFKGGDATGTDQDGSYTLIEGSAPSGDGNGGGCDVLTPDVSGAGDTGFCGIGSGSNTGTGKSGDAYLYSGNTVDDVSGGVGMTSGISENANSGDIFIGTGAAPNGTSGRILIQQEVNSNIGGRTDLFAGDGASAGGELTLGGGDGTAGNAPGGHIKLQPGSPSGSGAAGLVIWTDSYVVASLPPGVFGARTVVLDALAPTFLGVLVGGGAVKCPAFYNGANWVAG